MSLKPIVELRVDDFRSIAFKSMDFEDDISLMISVEDGGDGASFFFKDADELMTFAQRVIDAAHQFTDK